MGTAQIGSDLRYHDLGRPPAEARDRVYPLNHVVDWAHSLCDLDPQALDQVIHGVQVGELLCEQEAVMGAELTLERALQLGDLSPQLVLGQIRQHCWVSRSANQRFQHSPRRDARMTRCLSMWAFIERATAPSIAS